MMAESAHAQPTVVDLLRSKPLTLSAEIIPPRNGSQTEQVFKQIATLKEVPVDFISVTKGAGGSLRGGTLPIAQTVKDRFNICSLAHFTCRDYTTEEVENNLVDHHYFGVTNILALRGDPPDGQDDHFKPAPNRHSYAWQLVQQIQALNRGDYLLRSGWDQSSATAPTIRKGEPMNFCIGVAAHPEHAPHADGVEFLAKKVEMGANFAITQMLFSAEPYAKFLESCHRRGVNIPVIPGIRILTQAATAERMKSKFGVNVPDQTIRTLEKARSKSDGQALGMELAMNLCKSLIAAGAPGIHVFVMNDAASGATLLKNLK